MRTSNINNNYNINILMSLPLSEKVSIVNKLIKSMGETPVKDESNSLPMFSGAWDDGRTTEELTEELRASRLFTREVESW